MRSRETSSVAPAVPGTASMPLAAGCSVHARIVDLNGDRRQAQPGRVLGGANAVAGDGLAPLSFEERRRIGRPRSVDGSCARVDAHVRSSLRHVSRARMGRAQTSLGQHDEVRAPHLLPPCNVSDQVHVLSKQRPSDPAETSDVEARCREDRGRSARTTPTLEDLSHGRSVQAELVHEGKCLERERDLCREDQVVHQLRRLSRTDVTQVEYRFAERRQYRAYAVQAGGVASDHHEQRSLLGRRTRHRSPARPGRSRLSRRRAHEDGRMSRDARSNERPVSRRGPCPHSTPSAPSATSCTSSSPVTQMHTIDDASATPAGVECRVRRGVSEGLAGSAGRLAHSVSGKPPSMIRRAIGAPWLPSPMKPTLTGARSPSHEERRTQGRRS